MHMNSDIVDNKQSFGTSDHTFAICAYKDSPFLEKSVRSCLLQTVPGKVIIATSTPSSFIRGIAEKYNLQLFIRKTPEKGIAADWNFAFSCADTGLVTLAHQDDIYNSHYREYMLKAINSAAHPLIGFTDYGELREEKIVTVNRLLCIKRLLLLPLMLKPMQNVPLIRRFALSIGSVICCPSVTMVKNNIREPVFENNMKSNIDWQAWEKISRQKGTFVYIPKPLMLHRIHEGSETSRLIEADGRKEEDIMMFRKFWPEWAARLIEKIYSKAEKSNQVNSIQ